MRSIRILAIPLALAICVSTSLAQEAKNKNKDDEKNLAKAAKMLRGVWLGDAEKTAEEIKKSDDLDVDEGMIDMVLDQVAGIEATFKDGTYEVFIGDREMSGKWKIKEIKKKKPAVFLAFFEPDSDSEGQDKNFEIHILSKKHIKMVDIDEGGPPIVLKRQPKEKKDK